MTRPRKLSVEIAEQLQHNAARTKRGAGCAVNYDPRCMSAGCRSRVTVVPKGDGWVGVASVAGSERVIRRW